MSSEPLWTYNADSGVLEGPDPCPPVPQTTISAADLGASDHHDVAEIDQELELVTLGTGYVPQQWQVPDCTEHSYRIDGWKSHGWHARYRRADPCKPFCLTHVWADSWGATTFKPWC